MHIFEYMYSMYICTNMYIYIYLYICIYVDTHTFVHTWIKPVPVSVLYSQPESSDKIQGWGLMV